MDRSFVQWCVKPAQAGGVWRRFGLRGLLFGALLCGCQRSTAGPPGPKPAPPSEAVLGRVTLSAEAEGRLGIAAGLQAVSRRAMPGRRLLRGEVMAAPATSAWVLAPLAGVLRVQTGAGAPVAGVQVKQGQVLATIVESLGPMERVQLSNVRVDADAAVARAQAGDEAAAQALQRAERLYAEQAVGRKVVEEAQAQRAIAGAALRAAQAQRQSLDHGSPDRPGGGRGSTAPTAVLSPLTGTIREARVAPQAQVLAGTPLYEVVGTGERWVRVAVPAFELAALSREASAEVEPAGAATAEKQMIAARPATAAPATASPQASTVDRYFVLPPDAPPVIGQVVAVWLQEAAAPEVTVLPARALIHDPTGGCWVYERTAEHVFSRRRVEVVRMQDGLAVLGPASLQPRGLHLGSSVVTDGAIELYGAEFGSGK